MRGRRPELKIVRDGDTPPSAARRAPTPKPPAHLSAAAQEEWRRCARDLAEADLLTPRDRPAFAMLCESYARWCAAEAQLATLGALTVVNARGGESVHPLVRVSRGALADYVRMSEHFGLTPLSRGRVKGTQKRKSANPYLDP
jgi:P27 family predicted phage terminase small subunit